MPYRHKTCDVGWISKQKIRAESYQSVVSLYLRHENRDKNVFDATFFAFK